MFDGRADAGVVQRVAGVAELLLVEDPADARRGPRRRPRWACWRRTGRRRWPCAFSSCEQLRAQHAGVLDLVLVRHQLVAHELARGLDDQLLFFGEAKNPSRISFRPRPCCSCVAAPRRRAAHAPRRAAARSCSRSCPICRSGGPVAAARHGAGGDAVDEGDDRAQHLLAHRRRPARPFGPAAREAALEQPQVLAVHPGVDALQAPVRRHLAPEGDPEGALDVARLVDRQRLGEHAEQVRLRRPARSA